MITLIKIELIKLVKKSRFYISFLLLFILITLLYTGLTLEGENLVDYVLTGLMRQFTIEGNILNGYFISFLMLGSLYVHIPILIAIVTGDLLSSELESGTARLYLTRPVKRRNWLFAKFIVAVIFVVLFMLFLSIIIIVPGVLLFGAGDVIVLFQGFEIIEQSTFYSRFFGALLYSILGMSAFGVFTVVLSAFVKRSISTILITLGILIISTLLQNFAPGVFESWKPFLFTYHLSQWQLFFFAEIPWIEIYQSTLWLVIFSLLGIVITTFRFNKMHILE